MEELVADVSALDGLEAADSRPAAVGGASGIEFDARITAGEELRAAILGDGVAFAEGQQVRFIVMDVEGATKMITIEAPEDEFDQFLPEAEELLATLEWWP